MSKKQVIVFVVVMLIVTAFAFWKADFIKRYGSVAQVWVMVMLVLLTAAYVLSTRKMAQEMKEQRYSECLPLLAPIILQTLNTQGLAPNEVHYECLQSGVGIKVMWCNVGKGVAINSQFSFWTASASSGKATSFPLRELGTVEVGGKKEVDYSEILDDGQLHNISDAYQPRVEAEYLDIYERKVTTVQKFRIDEQNKKAFLGELYFTVNGRRLGEETT